MTQPNKKGMWLRPVEPEARAGAGWLLSTAAALLALAALLLPLAALTGFEKICHPSVMLLAGGSLCVIHGVLRALRRQAWFWPGSLVLLLALILLFRQQLLDGVCLFWNRLGDTWTASTGWVLTELEVQAGVAEADFCLVAVSVLAGMLGGLLCCALVSRCAAIAAVMLPGLLFCGMVFFRRDAGFGYLPLVMAAAALLLLYSGWERKKASLPTIVSWTAFGAAVCLLVLLAAIPGVADSLAAFSENLHTTAHERAFETKYTVLPEGDLSDFSTPDGKEQPGLIVTMDAPEAMYLRGFTGVTYEEGMWQPLDPQVLAEHEALLYWLNLNAFYPAAQFEASVLHTEITRNIITVQNVGACSAYVYVPFSLCAGNGLLPENLNSDTLMSDGDRITIYSIVSGSGKMIPQVLEYLQTSEEAAVLNYRKAESAYRGFVYEHYLQVPEEVPAVLAEMWKEAAAGYGGAERLTFEQAQECAKSCLERCFAEDGASNKIEQSLTGAEGTSFEYATVAAMTFRNFGIPARYAEGYVITQEMAAAAEPGTSIDVNSSCAEGWVEIYHDGIGWIPVDMIPGQGEEIPDDTQTDQDQEDDTENTEPSEGEELEERPEDPMRQDEPQGGTRVTISRAVKWGILIAVTVLLLLLLLLIIRRKNLLSRREQTFRGEDRNAAVAWIFAYTAVLLEQMGFDRGNGSMQTLYEPVRQRFGDEYAMLLREVTGLNARALFSSHELTEPQREKALAFCEMTLQNLKADTKWFRRLWMQWIRCLY